MKKKTQKEIRNTLISGLIGLILGWIGHFGFISIDNYFNRPKLDFKIESLTVNSVKPGDWEMRVVLYQENTGNSEAIFKLNECLIRFPQISDNPIRIKNTKTYTLNSRAYNTDTVLIPFPSFFKDITIDSFSTFQSIRLSFHDLRSKYKYQAARDSSELDIKGKLYLETENPPSIKDFMTIDGKTGDSILIRGIHNFFYKEKFYTNYFLPSDASVKQTIKDDKIFIEFATKANKPFLYLPHEDLKDKILFPNTAVFAGSIQHSSEDGDEYKNFEFTKKDDEGEMYFYLFK